MARIAMVVAGPFPSPQGSQVFAGQMADEMGRRGHEVHLLTYGYGGVVQGRHFEHHRIRRLPGDDSLRSGPSVVKPFLDGLMMRALVRLIGRQRIEVVHAHNYEAAIVGIMARRRGRVPVVYHSHNLMSDELSTYFDAAWLKRLADLSGRVLDRSVPKRADHVIALCNYSAERLLVSGVRPEDLSVIPPAISDDIGWQGRTAAKRALGIDAATSVVGYCGNLDAYQNLPLMFGAARELAGMQLKHDIKVVLATHLNTRAIRGVRVRLGIPDSVRILAAGSFGQAKRVIEASDVVVLPRRRGSGYPIKLLNYMSAGRAIVTAGCGAKVLRDGRDGVVVGDDDPRAMALAIRRLAADPYRVQALAVCARKRFEREMTWNAILPRIETVYDEVQSRASRFSPTHASPSG